MPCISYFNYISGRVFGLLFNAFAHDCQACVTQPHNSEDILLTRCHFRLQPAYHNLRQRVEGTLSRFLGKIHWTPQTNKNKLRNQLRRHIQEATYMEAGVERIVDQVVNPKVAAIAPNVEDVTYNYLGVAKPDGNDDDVQNGNNGADVVKMEVANVPDVVVAAKEEEDVEMRSPEEAAAHAMLSPQLRGDISPLTPDRKNSSGNAMASPEDNNMAPAAGDISPLTPPLPRHMPAAAPPSSSTSSSSPGTPPLPPPRPSHQQEETVEEEVVYDMSPVSDAELADVSPPADSPETPQHDSELPSPPPQPPASPPPPQAFTPPLPPGPMPPAQGQPRPPSPMTSPIGSSSDEMEEEEEAGGKVSGPSDISDTDLPASSQSENEDGGAGTSKGRSSSSKTGKDRTFNLIDFSEAQL